MRVTNAIARVLAACAGLFAAAALAQSPGYPDRPVKIIVPFAAAGPTDVVARLIALKLSEKYGQQFYIENMAGAGGNLGMGAAARAPADGYTILFVSSSYTVNPSLYAKPPYDPDKDFVPVTKAAGSPNGLFVHPSIPAKSVKELVELIKANPGKYTFASPGIGTTPHLSSELFKLTFGLDFALAPFPGGGPSIQSVVAGHTPMCFQAIPPATALVKDGKLRDLLSALESHRFLPVSGLSSGLCLAGHYGRSARGTPLMIIVASGFFFGSASACSGVLAMSVSAGSPTSPARRAARFPFGADSNLSSRSFRRSSLASMLRK